MNTLNPIHTEKATCQDCYKCLRHCSVKAIRIAQGRAAVVPELCVLCGRCVEVCPVGAKKVRDDLVRVRSLADRQEPMIAALAPSWTSSFPGVSEAAMVRSLKILGFQSVCETALGADYIAEQTARDLKKKALEFNAIQKHCDVQPPPESWITISSACPSTVEFIMKYHPVYASCISPLASPLLALDQIVHGCPEDPKREKARLVFIGPCIAKKLESDRYRERVYASLDFKDLNVWFDYKNAKPVPGTVVADTKNFQFEPSRAWSGRSFPVDGGMNEAIRSWAPLGEITFMNFCGLPAIERALAGLHKIQPQAPVFLEMLACEGGCVNGPRSEHQGGTIEKRLRIKEFTGQANKERRPVCATGSGDTARSLDFSIERHVTPVNPPAFSDTDIEAVLNKSGKNAQADELNCGGCGYNTCRDFASAVLEDKAELPMCVSYMRTLAQKKANSLISAIPAGVVIANRDLKIVECNHAFVKLMGEEALVLWEAKPGLEGARLEALGSFSRLFSDVLAGGETLDRDVNVESRILHATVFTIEKGHLVGAVFQDVTVPWVRRDRIVTQASRVIKKNLEVVQKIAYLLGENAAETETILNSIIESFDTTDSSAAKVPRKKKTPREKPLETGHQALASEAEISCRNSSLDLRSEHEISR